MCSTFKYKTVMGRNFDYEISYKEELRIVKPNEYDNRYGLMGMCTGLVTDYPLLYDAMNTEGLCVSALAFTDNAVYFKEKENLINIPSYDFPLYILGNYKSVDEVLKYIGMFNITDEAYSSEFPPNPLHWFIVDKEKSIIVEQTKNGLEWYTGSVLTNNPPYPIQEANYRKVKEDIGDSVLMDSNIFNTRGLETIGLNGDYTSNGRFERLTYIKEKLEQNSKNFNEICEGFHLLSSIEQIYGLTPVNNKYEYTIYSIIYDTVNIKCYLKRYDELILETARI